MNTAISRGCQSCANHLRGRQLLEELSASEKVHIFAGLMLTTSPAMEPSSCGGASRNGRDADLTMVGALLRSIAPADWPAKPMEESERESIAKSISGSCGNLWQNR